MALSWSIPSIRPGAGAFCFSNVWMWPKVDPSRPARNESAYRGTPGAGEAAVDVVGIPAYDPKRPNAATIPQFSDDQLWLGNVTCFGEAHHRHAESAPVTIKRDRQPVTD